MFYILFIIYLCIGCYFITRFPFTKNAGLGTGLLLGLFVLKIAAGLLIGWMSQKYYPQGNDYWGLNEAGWKEYRLLITDPKQFFTEIFVSPYKDGYDGFFNSVGSYWNDLKNTLISKVLACFNIFSRGNYYINSLFFNLIGFLGHVALYRVFSDIYQGKKWTIVFSCFLLPSTLYFSAGIHKDMIVFSMLGLYCYALYFSLKTRFNGKYIALLCISFLSLMLIRNFLAIALVPATLGLLVCYKTKRNPLMLYAVVYFIGITLAILLHLLIPAFQPLKVITQKQQDFFDLPYASSQLNTAVLEPTLGSFSSNLPQALDHGILQPYIWAVPTKFLVPLAIELLIYELMFLLMLFAYKRFQPINPFVVFGLFLAFTMLLFTGYIVPNTGSIVRYRSLYLPFLITPVLCHIYWKKWKDYLHIK